MIKLTEILSRAQKRQSLQKLVYMPTRVPDYWSSVDQDTILREAHEALAFCAAQMKKHNRNTVSMGLPPVDQFSSMLKRGNINVYDQ